MATIQRNILIRDRLNIKQNAKPQPRSRRAADTVSPSVRGIRAVNPSVAGIAERELKRITKAANAIGDTLAICQKIGAVSKDQSHIDAVTALTQILSKVIDQLRAEVDAVIEKSGTDDSILREQNAQQNTDDPEQMVTETNGQDAAVRRIQHARFSTARDQAAALGAVNPARIAAGLPDDVDFDPIATMESKR